MQNHFKPSVNKRIFNALVSACELGSVPAIKLYFELLPLYSVPPARPQNIHIVDDLCPCHRAVDGDVVQQLLDDVALNLHAYR